MGIFSTLFGSPAKSSNTAAPWVNQTYQPAAQTGLQGMNALAGALGGGFEPYAQNAGWNFELDQGLDSITGNAAAHGLLRSGPTGKAFVNYGNALKSRFYNDYLDRNNALAALGLNAGQLVTSANQVNKGADEGILGKIAQIAGAAASFSDIRLKTDIERIGEASDGLGLYRFRYLWDGGPREGVMAHEVAQLRPWALGPVVEGYATVRYDMLEAA